MKRGKYVHGYSAYESVRLVDQASTVSDLLHNDTFYPKGSKILEAGCGVGAQTIFLAKNNPQSSITSVDISKDSLIEAEKLVKSRKIGNVKFEEATIFELPYDEGAFDHIFVCYVLEHLQKPKLALESLLRVLKKGGTITVIEGDHGSCIFYPETKESIKAWNCLIKVQESLGCNSLIGRQLYPLLANVGFREVKVLPRNVYIDASKPLLVDGFIRKTIIPMVKGVKEQALKLNLIDEPSWEKGIQDLGKTADGGTFYYTFFKARGIK